MRLAAVLIFVLTCNAVLPQAKLEELNFQSTVCYGTSPGTSVRYTEVKDSILKKHQGKETILLTTGDGFYALSVLVFKERRKWVGIVIENTPVVAEGQALHSVYVNKFNADTIGPRLVALGAYSLKEINVRELGEFYNRRMKELRNNPAVDFELPYCSHSNEVSITAKGRTVTYGDCYYSDSILNSVQDIGKFAKVSGYLLSAVSSKFRFRR